MSSLSPRLREIFPKKIDEFIIIPLSIFKKERVQLNAREDLVADFSSNIV